MTGDSMAMASKSAAEATSPFHILMLPDGDTIHPKRQIDQTLCHDYLGKRYEAYKFKKDEKEDDRIWSGASTTEKFLIWCCEMPETSPVDQGECTLPGALRRDRVLKFVGYLAMYCHDVGTRALAIAILERTLEADLPAIKAAEEAEKVEMVSSELQSNRETQKTSDVLPTTRTQRRLVERSSSQTPSTTTSTDTTIITPTRKPDRLWQFLAAGGLKVLDQWVEDASRVIQPPKAPPGTRTRQAPVKDSPTGALLLPLLILLKDLPIDRQLVKQSKINRQIRRLSKEIDALVEKLESKDTTHPRAGGYSLAEVQTVLNDLKATWNAQQKMNESKERPSDPFQVVQEALQMRLGELKDYKEAKTAKPTWLVKAWEEKQLIERPKKKRRMSTTEMNRIDHQRERNLRIKEDLQNAEKQREEYQRRLREIKRKQESQKVETSTRTSRVGGPRVHWRDGMSHVSTTRKRDELEEVFVYDKTSSSESLESLKEAEADDELEEMFM